MALDQIGQQLKAAREGMGLSLAQIYERTKIPINHLQAIDSGAPDDLPEPVYVAGFIKRYADCVGLNGQTLSDEYRQSNGSNDKRDKRNGDGGWAMRAPVAQPVLVSSSYMKKARISDKPPSILKTVFYPTVLLLGCLWLVIALYQWQAKNNAAQSDSTVLSLSSGSRFNSVQPSAVPNGGSTQGGPTQAGPTSGQPAQPGQTDQGAPAAPSECRIVVTANKHVWVEVKSVATGNSVFTGFLEAGDRRDFTDPSGLRVHAGNGASLSVESDGKSQLLGAAGKISEKVFMAKQPAPAADGTVAGATGAATGTGSVLGANGTAVKPVVKKVVKRPLNSETASAPRKRLHSFDEGGSGGYLPGERINGTRSIDVPYRYNDGRLDSD
ncbi:MAG TPA: RodZ domain-containing protein [Chroococcales cyanobacterium]